MATRSFKLALFILAAGTTPLAAQDAGAAQFLRGLNLNGPPVVIDGQSWEGQDSPNYACQDNAFENQSVELIPPTDPERAKMIRSSRWGGNRVELKNLPRETCTIFLYVWEDNDSETFSVAVNGREVLSNFQSGQAGAWQKLGPWFVDAKNGSIVLTSRGGAANFSGIEIWRGEHDGESAAPISEDDLSFFEKRIRPLLATHCYECHSSESKEVEGELLVDSRPALRRGGANGPAVAPGEVDKSLLIQAVRYHDENLQMPPAGRLTDAEIADLEQWVSIGAPDPRSKPTKWKRPKPDFAAARQFWSLRPIADPPSPDIQKTEWPRNEIDRFILASMEARGLSPAEPADKRALLRRATFDLIGLPPTPEEIHAFLADDAPDAFAKVVDRLLASPHYGERWGRFWLDVVRYADTAGDNSDFPIPQMRRYRDWVIESFNRDLPYDKFVAAQLAGDLLPADDVREHYRQTTATGYIANSRRFGSRVDDYPQHLTVEDTIDNLGRAFLGLTINCARCHDHKFDPITTDDYYALYGIFQSTRYPWPGIELLQRQKDFIPLASSEEIESFQREQAERQKPLDAEVERLEKELEKAEGDAKKPLEEQLAKAKDAAQKNSLESPPYEMAYAVAEANDRLDAAVQIKGDPTKPGDVVPRRFLEVLGGASLPEDDSSSGRQRLAEWILAPDNPLPARVLANRLWLHHFGKGIVPTPNDFGKQGKLPTHPELLDALASRLVAGGWSIKAMHRLIMLSQTYQLSVSPVSDTADPNNDLYASYPRRRLDAEAIRDGLLACGDSLDRTPGGDHPFPPQGEWKFTQHNPFKAVYPTNKRSVYLMTQRIQRHPFLAIFDGADPSVSTPVRSASTTPLQALYFLNDPFLHEQSRQFAERLVAAQQSDTDRLNLAYEIALARLPTAEERDSAIEFLTSVRAAQGGDDVAAWQAMARVLFRLNEFVYLD